MFMLLRVLSWVVLVRASADRPVRRITVIW
jgi:hypothetical protein